MTPDEWQARQRAVTTTTVRRLTALWGRVDRQDIGGTWQALVPAAANVVARGQREATTDADRYVNFSLARQTDDFTPVTVNPEAFSGVASDGRPLDTLLTLPATTAGRAVAAGASPDAALASGAFQLVASGATQVYDAGRLATGVGITASQAGGYRRQLRGATNCARCVLLAGKWFRWNQGFQRHPRCDCVHVPSVGRSSDYAGTAGFDPDTYFDQLPAAEQDRIFGKAGAQAIRDGADVGQVVNARRGMRTTTMYGRKILTTTEGTARMGPYGRYIPTGRRQVRLMPEQIYADARDRDHAIELLRLYGFI